MAEPEAVTEQTAPESAPRERMLPFAFAKRQGVLLQFAGGEQPHVIYRPGVTPQSLAEVRPVRRRTSGVLRRGRGNL